MKKTVTLIVSSGQYETSAVTVRVSYTTERGLAWRVKQLEQDNAVYGDNWAGWIPASVAVASDKDTWGDNSIIGGQWCNPYYGYLAHDQDNIDWHKETDWAHFYAQAEVGSFPAAGAKGVEKWTQQN